MPDRHIGSGDRVTLHYTLSLASGKVVDTTHDKAPAKIVIGAGELLPAFEERLIGLKRGEARRFEVPCMDAFGPSEMDNVQTVARADFPAHLDPTPGLVVGFELPSGEEVAGTVVEVTGSDVYVNFAHPLAGFDLIFEVEVLQVEPGQP